MSLFAQTGRSSVASGSDYVAWAGSDPWTPATRRARSFLRRIGLRPLAGALGGI